jgi:hypothetical protein
LSFYESIWVMSDINTQFTAFVINVQNSFLRQLPRALAYYKYSQNGGPGKLRQTMITEKEELDAGGIWITSLSPPTALW